MIGRARVAWTLVLGGLLFVAGAPSEADAQVGTAPPPVTKQPAPTLKPRIVSFRRVQASPSSGPTTQPAAPALSPVSLSAFEVEIDNPGSSTLTSALAVKHVVRRPDYRPQELGPFPFTVAARSKTVVRFTDANPLDAGCGPTRYELSGNGLASVRFGRITPTCSFKWTTTFTNHTSTALSLTNVKLGKLPLTCGESWDISATLTAMTGFTGIGVAIGPSGTAGDVKQSFDPEIGVPIPVVLRGPFRGHDKYTLDAVGGADFAVNDVRPYTLDSGRTCTIDGGQLE